MFAIRWLIVVLTCALALFAPFPAVAEEEARLEIDRYPELVSHDSTIGILGHVEGSFVDSVSLQRRFSGGEWVFVGSTVPDSSGRVSFRVNAPRYSARYRFKSGRVHGDSVAVRVRARVTLDLSRDDVMEGSRVIARGSIRPLVAGRVARLRWKVNGEWRTIERVRVGDGRFRVRLRTPRHGRRAIRVIFAGDARNPAARDRRVLRVHDREPATWYGPGFFGNRTACGQRYHRDLLGVAHRTLPCGTVVSALYKGRSVRVPVVDRGPYGHANWDLTEETAQRLGFSGRDEIGVLRQRG